MRSGDRVSDARRRRRVKHWVKKGGHVHAYLFEQPRELTLVDTLFDDDAEPVLDCIRRIGRSPGDLKHTSPSLSWAPVGTAARVRHPESPTLKK